MIYEAGQVGLVEWVLIVIGILWVAGALRKVIYVPVIVKEEEKKKEDEQTRVAENVTISKPTTKGDSDEYVPFEEIKD
jgi:hypothetical protein